MKLLGTGNWLFLYFSIHKYSNRSFMDSISNKSLNNIDANVIISKQNDFNYNNNIWVKTIGSWIFHYNAVMIIAYYIEG